MVFPFISWLTLGLLNDIVYRSVGLYYSVGRLGVFGLASHPLGWLTLPCVKVGALDCLPQSA